MNCRGELQDAAADGDKGNDQKEAMLLPPIHGQEMNRGRQGT